MQKIQLNLSMIISWYRFVQVIVFTHEDEACLNRFEFFFLQPSQRGSGLCITNFQQG